MHGAAKTPVLLGEVVHHALGGSVGVNGGHQAFDDAEVVVDDFRERCKAVRGAGGVGDDLDVRRVGIEVHAADEHRRMILRRAGKNNDLSARIQMVLRGLGGQELTRALQHILRADRPPGKLLRVAGVEQRNALSVDDQRRGFAALGLDRAVEAAVHGIILHDVRELFRRLIRRVDADDFNVVAADRSAEHQTANAAKPVNANFNTH